jgi:hypothetical protein
LYLASIKAPTKIFCEIALPAAWDQPIATPARQQPLPLRTMTGNRPRLPADQVKISQTELHLTVQRGSETREVSLTLKEIL